MAGVLWLFLAPSNAQPNERIDPAASSRHEGIAERLGVVPKTTIAPQPKRSRHAWFGVLESCLVQAVISASTWRLRLL